MRLAIGMPIQDSIPGECYGYHVMTVVEAVKLLLPETMKDSKQGVVHIPVVNAAPHDAARFQITTQAVQQGCNRLFFMDADTNTMSGGITALMKFMDETPDCRAVSGHYYRRGYPYSCVWSIYQGDDPKTGKPKWTAADASFGTHEIHMTGLGCCLLDLDWIVKTIPEPWFRMKQEKNFTEITDDMVLFEAIRKAGGKIFGHADVRCQHVGRREVIDDRTADALRTYYRMIQQDSVIQNLGIQLSQLQTAKTQLSELSKAQPTSQLESGQSLVQTT